METFEPKRYVELFHLLFLGQLGKKLDRRLYALKGGCNLKFFFHSLRYSEDIDIDVHTMALTTLQKNIDQILSNSTFHQILKTKNIFITNYSSPKQTTTTQRWKVELATPPFSLKTNTKIEFSRRNKKTEGTLLESISRQLIITYQLLPIFLQHYTAEVAWQQKLDALILRNQTQARDLFDLYHLLQTQNITIERGTLEKERADLAMEQATRLSFPIFQSQVVSYLEPDYQSQYNDSAVWDQIVSTVCNTLIEQST